MRDASGLRAQALPMQRALPQADQLSASILKSPADTRLPPSEASGISLETSRSPLPPLPPPRDAAPSESDGSGEGVALSSRMSAHQLMYRLHGSTSPARSHARTCNGAAGQEFWRVWTLYSPSFVEFSESSPVFESIVHLFKRLGVLMAEAFPLCALRSSANRSEVGVSVHVCHICMCTFMCTHAHACSR